MSRAKKGFLIGLLLFLSVLALVYYFLMREKPLEVDKAEITRGSLVLKVTSRGKIEAKERYEVEARVAGPITILYVDEGTQVKAGESLCQIDDSEFKAQRAKERERLSQAQNALDQLQRRLDLIKAQEALDEAQLQMEEEARKLARARGLFEEGVIHQEEMDTRLTIYNTALLKRDLAQRVVDDEKKRIKEQEEILNAQIESAKASINSLDRQIQWAKVLSPFDGIVAQKFIKEGYYVNPGEQLFLVTSNDAFVAKTFMDEVDIAKVALGMECTVKPDAYPGLVLKGVITKIAPSPKMLERINAFEVTIDVEKPSDKHLKSETKEEHQDKLLRSEMRVDIQVVSSLREDVLKIPLEALLPMDDKVFVYQLENGKAKRKEVRVGMRNPLEAEVVSGIEEGTEVILNPPIELKEGSAVRAKESQDHWGGG